MRAYVWYISDRSKGPDGKWRTVERSTGCGLGERADAERQLGEYLIGKRDPRPQGPRDPAAFSVADCLSIYMAEHASQVAAPERIGYAVKPLLAWWGGQMLSGISGNTCRAYVRQRKASAATAGRELAVLSAACRHCEREGYLTRAPAVAVPRIQRAQRHRVFSRAELAAIIRAARSEPQSRDHLPMFVLLAAYTGKRSAVIRALQWRPNTEGDGWVDLDADMIHWGHSGTQKRRGDPTPIPRPLASLLRLRAKRAAKYVLQIPASRSRPSGAFKKSWRSALARAGVPYGRMHDLRHTAASCLLSGGVKPWLAAQYLGMSVATLTATYGHLIPGALAEAAKVVGGK